MRGESGETATIIHRQTSIKPRGQWVIVGFVIWIYRLLLNVLVLLHTKCYLLFICWQKEKEKEKETLQSV
jgi:hypothetical protein